MSDSGEPPGMSNSRKKSQAARMLELLMDGRWHSIQEIHQYAGTMRPNSRAADLRRRGFVIDYELRDGLHCYRLGVVLPKISPSEAGAPPPAPPAVQEFPERGPGIGQTVGPAPSSDPEQLALDEEAA